LSFRKEKESSPSWPTSILTRRQPEDIGSWLPPA
jgi:hypothetical protein